jgi:hypothetical protein
VSTDPEIGIPVYASWILNNVAEQAPGLLSAYVDIFADIYRSETTQAPEFRLVMGRLAATDPDRLPVDSIQADLDEMADQDDRFSTEAKTILDQLD